MSHVGRKHGRGADEIIVEAQAIMGTVGSAKRQAEIAALPQVIWKGRTLYTLRCQGWSGKGPHDVNVPLMQLWHLLDLTRFHCVYHAADALGARPQPAISWG